MVASNFPTYLAFLREARELAQKDGENFETLIHAFERIGSMELQKVASGMGSYRAELLNIARLSPLGHELPRKIPQFHIDACALFDLVRNQRNAAMHQGSVARNLVRHSIEFCLILEHALTIDMNKACDYMVRDICFAELDQPISYIRQRMLMNSYSYLPVREADESIRFLSDVELAKWLRSMEFREQSERLAEILRSVLSSDYRPTLIPAKTLSADISVAELVGHLNHAPILLKGSGKHNDSIVGLISAFDLL